MDEDGGGAYSDAGIGLKESSASEILEMQAEPDVAAVLPRPVANSSGELSANMAEGVSAEAITDAICKEYGLSQRERDVFVLLARGYTSTRIQKELYIAAGTVNYHSRNIYAKLGVHSKQELIALFEGMQL